jgi:signal transduction histidine kinase/ActR/RegA family two-component response regulator
MDQHLEAFNRALAWWFQSGDGAIDSLLNRVVFEARRNVASDVNGLSVLMKRPDTAFFVARGQDVPLLPVESLHSLFLDHQGARGGCRVRDHALDTVRFLEGRFRTSIMATMRLPESIVAGAEGAIWFGLQGGASAETIASAESMAKALSEWLESSAGVVSAYSQVVARRRDDQLRISELTALLHDARAPLGVLRYLAGEGLGADSQDALVRELEYLDKILAQGSPRCSSEAVSACDIGVVLGRVLQRHVHEFGVEGIRVERGYEDIGTSMPELDVERIITNLVSNAHRHSPGCRVVLGVESRKGRAVVSVRDDGHGISRQNLEALNRDQAFAEGPTSGWRVGIRSCKSKLRAVGGDLVISSELGRGTLVELVLPLVNLTPVRSSLCVADGGTIEGGAILADVVIIDDDQEHSESLKRLLERYGVRARKRATVDAFLKELSTSDGAIVLCDAHMPDGGAERLLTLLADQSHGVRVAVISGDATDDYLYKVSALGAQAFFCKPVDITEVCTWIREVQGALGWGSRSQSGKRTRPLVQPCQSI